MTTVRIELTVMNHSVNKMVRLFSEFSKDESTSVVGDTELRSR